jgi:hypothetical protein
VAPQGKYFVEIIEIRVVQGELRLHFWTFARCDNGDSVDDGRVDAKYNRVYEFYLDATFRCSIVVVPVEIDYGVFLRLCRREAW